MDNTCPYCNKPKNIGEHKLSREVRARYGKHPCYNAGLDGCRGVVVAVCLVEEDARLGPVIAWGCSKGCTGLTLYRGIPPVGDPLS